SAPRVEGLRARSRRAAQQDLRDRSRRALRAGAPRPRGRSRRVPAARPGAGLSAVQLALVRQRYNAYGGAERVIESAVDALHEQGVSVALLAREWVGDPGRVVRCDPFHIGRVWRDWSFARAVCTELGRRSFDLVQSHERIACCDVYRAGDGVHAQWLANRSAALGPAARLGIALNPYHRYVLAAERR